MSDSAEINSLNQLVEELKEVKNESEYKKMVKRLNIPLSDYEPYAHFNKEHYTRNCVARTKEFELILLCWEEGQVTPVHCHNNQECWVYVVKGEFDEQRFVESEKKDEVIEVEQEMQLEKDGISYMNDDMGYHSLENIHDGRSMSLHLYMNPIDECNIFNEETEEFEIKEMEYYSYKGKLLQEA
ncbi:MAG: cysteine dioxygenase family protein [Vicingaceae bacterium]